MWLPVAFVQLSYSWPATELGLGPLWVGRHTLGSISLLLPPWDSIQPSWLRVLLDEFTVPSAWFEWPRYQPVIPVATTTTRRPVTTIGRYILRTICAALNRLRLCKSTIFLQS